MNIANRTADCDEQPLSLLDFSKLEVIVKVSERCNLACSYCYYFYGGDESYKDRPGVISQEVIADLASFLSNGVKDFGIPRVKLVFHGGEPLLLRDTQFDKMCRTLVEALGHTNLQLHVQTNGVLISPKWIEVFRRYGINVCISMDGPPELNDTYRVDHKGRGSHSRIARGVQLLREAGEIDRFLQPSILSVLRAGQDYKKILSHIVDDLGVKQINLLLPDCSYDSGIPDGVAASEYGRILIDIFDFWCTRRDVRIREVGGALSTFHRTVFGPTTGKPAGPMKLVPILVVHSDGSTSINDSYIPAGGWRQGLPTSTLRNESMRSWFSRSVFAKIARDFGGLPTDCGDCAWKNVCRGGDFENRYSSARGFDNPSIFCDGLKEYYLHVAQFLVRRGFPAELMVSKLG